MVKNGALMKFFLLFCTALILDFSFLSCAQGSPEIKAIQAQVIRLQNSNSTFSERLSIFINYSDSDGEEDFARIIVHHDESLLEWRIEKDQKITRLRNKERWIGSNLLCYPKEGSFPKGSYTLIIEDLAGNEAIQKFQLQYPDFPETAPLHFTISDSEWKIQFKDFSNNYTRIHLILLDEKGSPLHSWQVPRQKELIQTGSLQALKNLASKATSVQCIAAVSNENAAIIFYPIEF